MAKSEFGKGLVICLVKFAEHYERWRADKQIYADMAQRYPDNPYNYESHAVEMFFNGASDHLSHIEVPKCWEKTKIGGKVAELQEFGLKIGHGFSVEKWAESDVFKAYELCREIALLIDKKLGLKPDIGAW